MKKLMAISSLLALVSASGGLFAVDIPVGEDEGSKFVLNMQAEYEFDVVTDTDKPHDNDKNWIEELDADKQGKVSVAASYDGDNYAFGVEAGFRQKRASNDDGKEWYLDDAWGKYYLMDKQFSIRGGGLAGDWGGTIWDTFEGSWSDDNPGVQLAFAPSALTGLSVAFSLPVPTAGTRKIWGGTDGYWTVDTDDDDDDGDKTDLIYKSGASAKYGNWGPAYPILNMVFGLRLNQTIPGLDFSTELRLRGNASTNGKIFLNGKDDPDEGEGDFQGMDLHFLAKYTFSPVTFQLSVPIYRIADGRENAHETVTQLAARLTFDIPNGEGSALDLGDPWIQLKMMPGRYGKIGIGETWERLVTFEPIGDDAWKLDDIAGAKGKKESFKDIFIDFEWEPSYSIVQDKIKAYLLLGFGYAIWADAPEKSLEKDYPIEFAVRPKIEFKFAPNATLSLLDKVFFLRKATKEGLRNEFGFRFAWAF